MLVVGLFDVGFECMWLMVGNAALTLGELLEAFSSYGIINWICGSLNTYYPPMFREPLCLSDASVNFTDT